MSRLASQASSQQTDANPQPGQRTDSMGFLDLYNASAFASNSGSRLVSAPQFDEEEIPNYSYNHAPAVAASGVHYRQSSSENPRTPAAHRVSPGPASPQRVFGDSFLSKIWTDAPSQPRRGLTEESEQRVRKEPPGLAPPQPVAHNAPRGNDSHGVTGRTNRTPEPEAELTAPLRSALRQSHDERPASRSASAVSAASASAQPPASHGDRPAEVISDRRHEGSRGRVGNEPGPQALKDKVPVATTAKPAPKHAAQYDTASLKKQLEQARIDLFTERELHDRTKEELHMQRTRNDQLVDRLKHVQQSLTKAVTELQDKDAELLSMKGALAGEISHTEEIRHGFLNLVRRAQDDLKKVKEEVALRERANALY